MSAGGRHLKDEGTQGQAIIAGGFAGLFSRFCIAPLDVVKINLQLQTHDLRSRSRGSYGIAPTVKYILQNSGIRGFWRGNVSAELLYVTYGATQFSTYRLLSRAFNERSMHPSLAAFASGATAGAVATTVTYPLDLLRTRFAAQGSTAVYRSFTGSIMKIALEEGTPGFFQGLPASLVQIVPYMGLFFAVYESLRSPLQKLDLPFGGGDATAGILAGAVAKTGVFPLDLIRKRLQVQGPLRSYVAGGSVPEYGKGVWLTGRTILISEGWRGLYKGLGISLIKAAPASAITMWSYENALRQLKRWEVLK